MAADVNIRIGADNTEFIKKVRETQTLGHQLAKSMSTAIGVGVANLAGTAMSSLTGIVRDSVAAYQASYAANQKLESVIRATGGAAGVTSSEIRNLASNLQGLTNFEDDATINASAVLLTFKNIGREVMLQTIPLMQDLSAVFGQDLQSSAVQLGKALDDPIQGINALRRVGVSFTDAQRAMIEEMVEGGNVAKAQGVILEVLAGQVGGAAQSMADGATQVSNAWGDLLETIGESSVNAINKNKDVITETISATRSFWLVLTNPSTWDDFARGGFNAAAQMAELDYQIDQASKETKTFTANLNDSAKALEEEEQRLTTNLKAFDDSAKKREELARSIRDLERQDRKERAEADEEKRNSVDEYISGEKMRLQETVEVNDRIIEDDIRATEEKLRRQEELKNSYRSFWSSLIMGQQSFANIMRNIGMQMVINELATVSAIVTAWVTGEEAKTESVLLNVAIRIGAFIKESIVAIGTGLKTIAVTLFDSFLKFFSFLGPFAVPAAIASVAGSVVAIKAAIQQITGFAEGGFVDRPTLAMIGEGSQRELVAPENSFIDAINRVILPNVAPSMIDYDKLGMAVAKYVPRSISVDGRELSRAVEYGNKRNYY